jgi:hypothetical protein
LGGDLDLMSSSLTLPASGSMRSGRVYGRPTSAPPISAAAGSPSADLLPTPSANQFECDPDVWEPRRAKLKAQRVNGNGFGLTLGMAVQTLPTPRASARENRQTKRSPSQQAGRHGLSLAAEVCELLPTPQAHELTGGSTGQPSPGGKPSLDALPLGQLNLDQLASG